MDMPTSTTCSVLLLLSVSLAITTCNQELTSKYTCTASRQAIFSLCYVSVSSLCADQHEAGSFCAQNQTSVSLNNTSPVANMSIEGMNHSCGTVSFTAGLGQRIRIICMMYESETKDRHGNSNGSLLITSAGETNGKSEQRTCDEKSLKDIVYNSTSRNVTVTYGWYSTADKSLLQVEG